MTVLPKEGDQHECRDIQRQCYRLQNVARDALQIEETSEWVCRHIN